MEIRSRNNLIDSQEKNPLGGGARKKGRNNSNPMIQFAVTGVVKGIRMQSCPLKMRIKKKGKLHPRGEMAVVVKTALYKMNCL